VVAVGLGLPAMAEDFRRELRIPFPVLLDPKAETYRLMQWSRGNWMEIIGPGRWLPGLKAMAKGYALTLKGLDVKQLGGAVVIGPDGLVRYSFRSRFPEEPPRVDDLLRHL
jgi:hypothetical protein